MTHVPEAKFNFDTTLALGTEPHRRLETALDQFRPAAVTELAEFVEIEREPCVVRNGQRRLLASAPLAEDLAVRFPGAADLGTLGADEHVGEIDILIQEIEYGSASGRDAIAAALGGSGMLGRRCRIAKRFNDGEQQLFLLVSGQTLLGIVFHTDFT
jgi:hypothetical protein